MPELVWSRLSSNAHLLAQPGVEVAERLVEQQHLRLADDGARERDPLLLAAARARRRPVGESLKPTSRSTRASRARDLRAARALGPGAQRIGDVSNTVMCGQIA